MPIREGKDQNGDYFQYGQTGKKYYYKPNDAKSRKAALEKAKRQKKKIEESMLASQNQVYSDLMIPPNINSYAEYLFQKSKKFGYKKSEFERDFEKYQKNYNRFVRKPRKVIENMKKRKQKTKPLKVEETVEEEFERPSGPEKVKKPSKKKLGKTEPLKVEETVEEEFKRPSGPVDVKLKQEIPSKIEIKERTNLAIAPPAPNVQLETVQQDEFTTEKLPGAVSFQQQQFKVPSPFGVQDQPVARPAPGIAGLLSPPPPPNTNYYRETLTREPVEKAINWLINTVWKKRSEQKEPLIKPVTQEEVSSITQNAPIPMYKETLTRPAVEKAINWVINSIWSKRSAENQPLTNPVSQDEVGVALVDIPQDEFERPEGTAEVKLEESIPSEIEIKERTNLGIAPPPSIPLHLKNNRFFQAYQRAQQQAQKQAQPQLTQEQEQFRQDIRRAHPGAIFPDEK